MNRENTLQNIIFSGVQPTGNLHLGNYLGAIKSWVKLQLQYRCLFCIVDLHAITIPQDPKALLNSTRETLAAYIASGIDPKTNIIFNQSAVPQHAELAWILGCHTPLGWLNRMTQFKEKAGKHRENAVLGLYSYPVLMAADILLYKATHVPVGEDQKQHLELARDIAGAFNRSVNEEFFPIPEPLITEEAPRVMSLRDGKSKMSKSDPSDQSRIHLKDSAEEIALKIKRAKSDAEPGISYDIEKRPEASNLLTIFSALTNRPRAEIEQEFGSSGFAQFKQALSDAAVEALLPIQKEMTRLLQDHTYLDSILKEGCQKAEAIAVKNLRQVKELTGFLIV